MDELSDSDLKQLPVVNDQSLQGRVLDSKFEVLGEIARGGMGIVYRGKDVSLGRSVAIKVLMSQFNTDTVSVTRFQREARAMASLDHPNIVSVYAIGHEFGFHYFVMKFLSGWTVAERLKRARLGLAEQYTQVECRDYLVQLCRGLDHAHQRNLIHRDIKPSNIMVSENGHATIMDFGIVKEATDDSLTKTGIVFGTPDYMAPEHAQGKPPTPATDLYSLGIVAYEMLTGEQPFTGSTPFSMVLKHIQDPPPPMIKRRPNLSPQFQDVIFKAIEKSPSDRFSSAQEMINALLAIQFSQTVQRPSISTGPEVDLFESGSKDSTPKDELENFQSAFQKERVGEPDVMMSSSSLVHRPSLPKNRPSVFTGSPGVQKPVSMTDAMGVVIEKDSASESTLLKSATEQGGVGQRPGHYQTLVTAIDSGQADKPRTKGIVAYGFAGAVIVVGIVYALMVFLESSN